MQESRQPRVGIGLKTMTMLGRNDEGGLWINQIDPLLLAL
jgi:hypothetical protein